MEDNIFDTHCHYNLEPLYSGKAQFFSNDQVDELGGRNWNDHWKTAGQNGVVASLVAGTDLKASQLAVEICQGEDKLFASIGLNPVDFHNHDRESLLREFELMSSLVTNKKVVAIGETGLDYFRFKSDQDNSQQKSLQKEIFIKHMKLANQAQKPLIIHARDTGKEAYLIITELLKKHYQFSQPFVLHCASGPVEYIKQALEMGGYISFAGNITYPNANSLKEILAIVPSHRLLIETDAPFLPPQKHRGKINQPKYIRETANYLKENFEVNLTQIFNNSLKFFNLSF
ncbi:MAG: YabD [Microgenomates bacterium 39_7]|nr:MAG: YabD [Microgenomates bacterium 39_7]